MNRGKKQDGAWETYNIGEHEKFWGSRAAMPPSQISERTRAGLVSARAWGRKGGRPFKMTTAKLRLAMAAMEKPKSKVGDLCKELVITRQALYRHILPAGELRPDGKKLFNQSLVTAVGSQCTPLLAFRAVVF